jgi:hypothetical protein
VHWAGGGITARSNLLLLCDRHHSRSAVGMSELPYGVPVEIEAEVQIS